MLLRSVLLRFLAVLLAFLADPAGAQQAPPETFSEQLVIREREILVDLPDNASRARLAPGDFQVLVDGQPREVTRAEPVAAQTGAPWTILVYVDEVLAQPGTVFLSGVALAERASDLARLGTLELVVAGSDPDVVLPATRDAGAFERQLTETASKARLQRDRAAGKAAPGPSPLQTQRQIEKLLAFLAGYPTSGPRALFLVADGADLPPEQIALLERASSSATVPAGLSPAAAAYREASRMLAAYGWVTLALPLRTEEPEGPSAPQTEVNILRQSSAPSDHQAGVPPVIAPGRAPGSTALSFPRVVDVFLEPRTASLRALAQSTAGTVVGYEVQLDPLLRNLPRRWRVWISEPDTPVDGGLQSLAVTLPGRNGVVRAPAWLRASTPELIAVARLENLLAGRPSGGDLPVNLSLRKTERGTELSIEAAPIQVPESARPGPVRVSYAVAGPEGATGIRHETLPVGDQAGKGWRQAVRLEVPPGARKIAVVVDALGPERWAGRVLEVEP